MPDKTIEYSKYNANFSGILPRGNMPHFQKIIKSLDFAQLIVAL
jgi:hypothetical protein